MPQISSIALHPVCAEAYEGEHGAMLLEYLLHHFGSIFGVSPVLVTKEFRDWMEKIIKLRFPRLRRSAARALIENRVPGIPRLLIDIPPGVRGHLRKSLQLLDLLETIHTAAFENHELRTNRNQMNASPSVRAARRQAKVDAIPEAVFRIMGKGAGNDRGKWQCVNCASFFVAFSEVRNLDGPCPTCGYTTPGAQEEACEEVGDGVGETQTG